MSEGLRQACQELWTLDQSRLVPGKDYTINLQVGQRSLQLDWRANTHSPPVAWGIAVHSRDILGKPS